MPEAYAMEVESGRPRFAARSLGIPDCILGKAYSGALEKEGLAIAARMGDPDLLNCVVFRREKEPGGIFALHDGNGFLFAAVAENNLAFALGMGYFGELVANARYGVDVFENLEEPND